MDVLRPRTQNLAMPPKQWQNEGSIVAQDNLLRIPTPYCWERYLVTVRQVRSFRLRTPGLGPLDGAPCGR